jgi:chromosome partitioning protein
LQEDGLEYDFILIDCPPSFGFLSLNALVAAQRVIIPVQSESFAIAGLQQMETSIQDIRNEADHDLQFQILMTLSDPAQKLHQLVDQEIRSHFKSQVFKSTIPVEPKIAESAFLGRPVVLHSPNSWGAQAYINACAELIQWCEGNDYSIQDIHHTIMEGLNKWLTSKDVAPSGHPLHLDDDGPVEHEAQEIVHQPEPNSFKVSIRNGVILALALTAGMAVAFLGMN